MHDNNEKINSCFTNVCFFNVPGMNYLFNLDNDSVKKLLQAEINCFCETWCQYPLRTIPDFFQNNTTNPIYSFATKDEQKGRASGGIILIKKGKNC